MAINKVEITTENGVETLIDLTGVSVTAESLLKGITALNAAGELIVGVLEVNQSGLPAEYQEVEYISAGVNDTDTVNAYIDLGFAFDTAATIHMSLYMPSGFAAGYPFGAAEKSGTLRCCLTAPYSSPGNAYLYGSNGSKYLTATLSTLTIEARNDLIITFKEGELSMLDVEHDKIIISNQQTAYTMTNNLYLFAQNYNGTPRFGVKRQIYAFKYYDKNDELICNLVPCYRKSDEAIGMYDLVRQIFLTNAGTGTFTKGADV